MSYEPTNWATGNTVTAEKLNKLEQGVANAAGLVVHSVYDETTQKQILDKTWQEIFDAYSSGKPVILFCDSSVGDVDYEILERYSDGACKYDAEMSSYEVWWNQGGYGYTAETANDYPHT